MMIDILFFITMLLLYSVGVLYLGYTVGYNAAIDDMKKVRK